jgi:hypothetical protein
MPALHDVTYCTAARARVESLRPDSVRQWGRMSVDQMLWHVNRGFENAMGRYPIAAMKAPMPRFLMRFLAFSAAWRRGKMDTAPEFKPNGKYDFEAERARTLALIAEFAARDLNAAWESSGVLGDMSGNDWSRLMAKHLDHHLRQFSV